MGGVETEGWRWWRLGEEGREGARGRSRNQWRLVDMSLNNYFFHYPILFFFFSVFPPKKDYCAVTYNRSYTR